MAGYVVLAIEGVLSADGRGIATSEPIPAGTQLYVALRKYYKLVLVTHDDNEERIERWLDQQGIKSHTLLVTGAGTGRDPQERKAQLTDLRGRGFPLDLFIDSSPAAVAAALQLGVTSLLFSSPRYARPEFRPDAKTAVREWATMEAEVRAQRVDIEPVPTADLEV